MLLLVPFLCMLSVVGEDRLMLCLKIHSYTYLSCFLAQAVLLHWEQSENVALILQYATTSLKMLKQLNVASPKMLVVSSLCRCSCMLSGSLENIDAIGYCTFSSREQEGIIMSDWISSHDVCNSIC